MTSRELYHYWMKKYGNGIGFFEEEIVADLDSFLGENMAAIINAIPNNIDFARNEGFKEGAKQLDLANDCILTTISKTGELLEKERNETLEEAAKIAESEHETFFTDCNCESIASSIRALKDKKGDTHDLRVEPGKETL